VWVTVDSRTGVDFYSAPLKIFELKTTIPNNYQHVRLNVRSGVTWPHQLREVNNQNQIGLKNLEIYSKKNVTNQIFNNDGSQNLELVPNLCGYLSSDPCLGKVESFWIGV
jgi:hypothetical protein